MNKGYKRRQDATFHVEGICLNTFTLWSLASCFGIILLPESLWVLCGNFLPLET